MAQLNLFFDRRMTPRLMETDLRTGRHMDGEASGFEDDDDYVCLTNCESSLTCLTHCGHDM